MPQPDILDRPAPEPYLTVVVTAPGDDRGDALKRTQAFINGCDEQCRLNGLDAEVIVVEWNLPPGRPGIGSQLRLPQPRVCTYRFIEVAAESHPELRCADARSRFRFIARNVGIRRARGRFVLATSIDVIFPTELFVYLAARTLQAGYLYRVDRRDVQADFPGDASLETQLAYCANHQLRVHTRHGTEPVDSAGGLVSLQDDIVDGRAIRLGAGWHVREGGAGTPCYRWATDRAELLVDDAYPGAALLELDIESNPYDPRSWVNLEALDAGRIVWRAHVTGRMHVAIPEEQTDRAGGHVIELRVVDAHQRSRRYLPVFERRDPMHYRVYSARIRMVTSDRSTVTYSLAGWANANPSSAQTVRTTAEGLEVVSDPLKWSYCVHYGPLRAPSRSTYRFELLCSVLEGRILVGILNARRDRWIPSSVAVQIEPDRLRFRVTVKLPRRDPFWLMVYNDHPDGRGASRFIVRGLSGPAELVAVGGERGSHTGASALVGHAAEICGAATAALRSRCRAMASARKGRDRFAALTDKIARVIVAGLTERVRNRIARAAPEYRSIEDALRATDSQLRALAPFCELAPVDQFLRAHRPVPLHLNCCGDFQLMAREHWDDLCGYPELAIPSTSVAGLFSHIADTAGIKEKMLPMPIYHVGDAATGGESRESEMPLARGTAGTGVTGLDGTLHIWAAYMQWLRRPVRFNSADWGMGGHSLQERSVTPVYDAIR